jgi:hypothetical protein
MRRRAVNGALALVSSSESSSASTPVFGTFTPDVPGAYIVKVNSDGTLSVLSAPEGSKHRKPERPWHARFVEPTRE